MVHSIALYISLVLHVHQIGGGFLRFNDPEQMTAPLDLEDLDSGSYDELIKYNPSLADPFRDVIRYGGDPNKPFDWSAPEIEAQEVELVRGPYESMYKDETEGIAEENRDEINRFVRVNRAETAKISKVMDEIDISAQKNRDTIDITAEKNRNATDITADKNKDETVKKIAEKNRNDTGIDAEKNRNDTGIVAEKNRNDTDKIAEKIRDKTEEKPSSLKYFANYPVWMGNKTPVYVKENRTDVQNNTGGNNLINNNTNKKTDFRLRTRILDLNIARPRRPRINISKKKILRRRVWPKYRSYQILVPDEERTMHDRHIDNWDLKRTHDYNLTGNYIASCYRCGQLKYGKWWRPSVELRERNRRVIPTGVLCYEAFQGDDWRSKTKVRLLRSRCYNNEEQTWNYEIGDDNYNFYHECVSPKIYPWLVNRTFDNGNPVECFARYTGKCFKRFLDVGKVYTERGCASWPPHESNSFAGHRFTKLEYLLHEKDNACVSSPLASLTPFDRGVSLYVRYHVCVCTGKWCNAATHSTTTLLLLFTLSFLSLVYGT